MFLQKCELTKQVYVDLLEVVNTAELIQFMMHLIKDQCLIIVGSVVLHHVIDCNRNLAM